MFLTLANLSTWQHCAHQSFPLTPYSGVYIYVAGRLNSQLFATSAEPLLLLFLPTAAIGNSRSSMA
jgi:hypothetical protein